jgi:hypothetical protein
VARRCPVSAVDQATVERPTRGVTPIDLQSAINAMRGIFEALELIDGGFGVDCLGEERSRSAQANLILAGRLIGDGIAGRF